MKNIKQFIICILFVILSLSLFACSSNSVREDETTVETSSVSIEQTTTSESTAYSQSSEESIYSEVSSQTVINSEESSEQISETSVQEQTYTVTIQSTSVYGNVTASKTSDIQSGTTVTFNVSANAYCKLDYLKVNGVDIVVNNNVATYVVTQNCVVTYSFSQIKYSINCYPSSNGTITTSPVNNAVYGANVTVTVTPNQNYTVGTLTLSYGSTTRQLNLSGNTATFTMPAESVILSATYNVKTFNIVCAANSNGTISTSPENSAISGSQIVVTATPNSDYVLENIVLTYGGNSYNLTLTGNTAIFIMPESNVTISAEFTKIDNREYVSYMLLGDSYTDMWWYNDFESDFSSIKNSKDIGVGGTVVTQWVTALNSDYEHWGEVKAGKVSEKYNVSNFIFHIGVNDITVGATVDETINNLKYLFNSYHNAYPSANIYWISLSFNSMLDASYKNSYVAINSAMQQYISGISYLSYIDTCSVMFPDGNCNPDWFADGLHFNVDGYATWSALILQAIGYPRAKVGAFGNAGVYYSSGTFKEQNGVVYNNTNIFGEQSVWFDGVYSTNAYAEMKVTVNNVANEDEYPKFGLALKSNGNHMFFYIDVKSDLSGKASGVTQRYPTDPEENGYTKSSSWDWTLPIFGMETNFSYTNGNYVKLGLLKSCGDLYFYINDVLVNSVTGLSAMEGNAAIGLTLFNLNVSIKDYSVTTNIDSIIAAKGLAEPAKVSFNDFTNMKKFFNAMYNDDVTGEISAWVNGIYHSKFYYEADITLRAVLDNDQYPKAGLALLNFDIGTLFFYIDSVNVGDFGGNPVVGYVFRPAGGDWDWANSQTVRVEGLKYTKDGNGNDIYATLGVYKDGGRYVFFVNGQKVMETTRTDLCTETFAGFTAFNLDCVAVNAKVATSDKIISRILASKGVS